MRRIRRLILTVSIWMLFSGMAAFAVAPADPAYLRPISLSINQEDGSVTLAWDANTETDLKGYKIYWGLSSGTYGVPHVVLLTALADVSSPSYQLTGLGNGTWYFAVTAFNFAELESGYSNEVSATISGIPPQPPTGLYIVEPIAFDSTGTTVKIAWKSVSPAISKIEYSYEGGPFRSVLVSMDESITDHWIHLRDLEPGKLYTYQVICSVGGVESSASGSFKTW